MLPNLGFVEALSSEGVSQMVYLTSLRRPTPIPSHHRLLLPFQNGLFWPKNACHHDVTWFSAESGLQTMLSFPLSARKTGEFQPAEHVTACHRFVTASSPLSFGPKSAQKRCPRGPVLDKFESIWNRVIHQWLMNGQGWLMNGQGWLMNAPRS